MLALCKLNSRTFTATKRRLDSTNQMCYTVVVLLRITLPLSLDSLLYGRIQDEAVIGPVEGIAAARLLPGLVCRLHVQPASRKTPRHRAHRHVRPALSLNPFTDLHAKFRAESHSSSLQFACSSRQDAEGVMHELRACQPGQAGKNMSSHPCFCWHCFKYASSAEPGSAERIGGLNSGALRPKLLAERSSCQCTVILQTCR